MEPKVIAFYLPQFHKVPENDEWWGEDFTDWVSARNAKPLFPGHYQPRIPDHNNYYDLLDKSTMEWQAKLARKAGIYGFCIYHYWFGDKQLLEKPAENLLKWKDIDIHFCFSWANDSWIRSWSKLEGNAWMNSAKNTGAKDSGMLVEQKYGEEEEWKRHFYYLLPFFQDKRYIKKDNKPVFVIYRPAAVKCMRRMADCWNKLALENEFSGIYFIGTNCDDWKKRKLNAALQYEPIYTRFHDESFWSFMDWQIKKWREFLTDKNIYLPELLSYRKAWNRIANRKLSNHVFPGGFVDFDTSPRKGMRATVFRGGAPRIFKKYFLKLYKKCKENGTEFIFLTAWNEWGEGAYLEPDMKYGVGYLNVIREITHK